jgi:hypothetical protein
MKTKYILTYLLSELKTKHKFIVLFVAKLMIHRNRTTARLAIVGIMYSSWLNNFSVYYDNLSVYYICTILLSCLAVFLTWWLVDSEPKHPQDDTNHVRPAHVCITHWRINTVYSGLYPLWFLWDTIAQLLKLAISKMFVTTLRMNEVYVHMFSNVNFFSHSFLSHLPGEFISVRAF